MKNTQLSTKEDRSERTFFAIIGMGTFAVMLILTALLTGCTPVKYSEDPLLQTGTPEQKAIFLECSQNKGDQGCDSCYYLVYGKHINPFTGEEIK